MNTTPFQIRKIFLPYLYIVIGLLFGYTTLRWVIFEHLHLFSLKSNVINFWIPTFLSIILFLIVLGKKISILNTNDKALLYYLVLITTMAAPVILTQYYVEKAFYKLIEIDNVNGLLNENLKGEKFFLIKDFQVNPSHLSSVNRVPYKSGVNYDVYITSPFENSKNIWLGTLTTNRITISEETQELADSLIEESINAYEIRDFYKYEYFEKVEPSNDLDGYLKAIRIRFPQMKSDEVVILNPVNYYFEDRIDFLIPWIIATMVLMCTVSFLMLTLPNVIKEKYDAFLEGKQFVSNSEDTKIDYIKVHKGTLILVSLSLTYFVVMIFLGVDSMSPPAEILLKMGGLRRWEVLNGEYWRLITSSFIHDGLKHLILNMFILFFVGLFVEQIVKSGCLILIYLTCAIGSSLGSIFWHENAVSVGASGAIFGFFGVLIVFMLNGIYKKEEAKMILFIFGPAFVLSIVLGLFINSDNAAHFSGLFSGILVGAILIKFDEQRLFKNAMESSDNSLN